MSRTVDVLLVEDNPADVRLAKEMLSEIDIKFNITTADDGEKAITMLTQAKMLPELVLLDLNLPKIGGIEVLRYIRKELGGRRVCVAILTGSLFREDRLRAQELEADGYFIKPMGVDEMVAVAQSIRELLTHAPSCAGTR